MKLGDENIIYNLRNRWPKELARMPNEVLLLEYENFSSSHMHGDNDARFLEWCRIEEPKA